jgi:hypothetical protein
MKLILALISGTKLSVRTPSRSATKKPLAPKTPVASTSARKADIVRPHTAGPVGSSSKPDRSAATIAKELAAQEKKIKTTQLKEKWEQEREEKQRLQREKRQAELASSREELRALAEKRRVNKMKEQQVTALQAKSRVDDLRIQNDERAQLARDLKQQELEKRRESAELKLKAWKEAQEKDAEAEKLRKEQERELLEARRLGYLQAREAARQEEESRRQSLVQRAAEQNKQREAQRRLDEEQAARNKDILEFRREASKGKDDHVRQEKESRRRSLAFRLDRWRKDRSVTAELRKQEQERLHAEFELKSQEWKDVQEFKRSLEEERRESLRRRLDQWREERGQEEVRRAEQAERDSFEKELFAQECEDILNYKQSLETQRRESLAYRLNKSHRDRNWKEGQEAMRAAEAQVERRRVEAERLDVESAKASLDADRRASLAFRLQHHVSNSCVYVRPHVVSVILMSLVRLLVCVRSARRRSSARASSSASISRGRRTAGWP